MPGVGSGTSVALFPAAADLIAVPGSVANRYAVEIDHLDPATLALRLDGQHTFTVPGPCPGCEPWPLAVADAVASVDGSVFVLAYRQSPGIDHYFVAKVRP